MIRQINFKIAPATALWRFQCLVTAVGLLLLQWLPLTFSSRVILCLLLVLIGAKLWRQRSASENFESLSVDGDRWKLRVNGNDRVLKQCRAEYFSNWLVLLSYQQNGRRHVLPVFPAMISAEDFCRLLAQARSMGKPGHGDVGP